MCLELVEELVQPGMSVVDLGTGSGILAVAAARLDASPIQALDSDEIAVKAARENARINQVSDAIQVSQGSLGDLDPTRLWDLLLVNILAPVILQFFRDGLASYIRPGGLIVLSGIIEEQLPDILAAMNENQLALVEQRQVKDWVTLLGRR
jgi:ribosomal protein L11 methyltransferase